MRPRAGPRRAGEAKEAKEAKDILERAATEADAVGDDRLRAKALSALIFVLGEGGTANISFLRNQALAALGRSGGDVALEAVLHINVATALMSDARRDEARVELERTLAILGELHEEHANNAEAARNNLAIIDLEEGKPDAAIAESNQVLDDIERSVGKLHPLRADAFDNRGLARAQLLDFAGAASDFAGAASDFAEARAIIATLSGPHGTSWALFAADEADALLELGRAAEALALATDALAAFEDSSPDSPELGRLPGNVACADLAFGRVTTALPLLERAVKVPSREAPLEGAKVEFALARALGHGPRAGRGSPRDHGQRAKGAALRAGPSGRRCLESAAPKYVALTISCDG